MRTRELLAGLLFLLPGAASSQSVGKMLGDDFKNFGGDVWAVWTSPFHATKKDWLTTGLVIGGSALISPFDDEIDRAMVRNVDNDGWVVIKELREGGALFSGKYITPVAGAVLIYALATKNTKIQEGIFGCLASYASTSIVRNYVVYYLVGRERPDSARDDAINSPPAQHGDQYQFTFPGSKDWGMHSLPAGHVANIMACATFLNRRFDMGYVEPALYALTAGIGVGRLVDRRHWMSDTFLGIAFGYASGRVVAKRSYDRANPTAGGLKSAMSGAYLSPERGGLTIGWKRTFYGACPLLRG